MIYMPRARFLFLRVPRTASTTLSDVLQEGFKSNANGVCTPIYYKNINTNMTYSHIDVHCNIKELIDKNILTEEEVANLDIYAVIRDPIDRYKSYCAHVFTYKTELQHSFKTVDNLANSGYELLAAGFKPQINWLQHNEFLINNIFNYDRIPSLLLHLSNKYSVQFKSLPHHRGEERNNNTVELNYSTLNKLLKDHERDFELYERYK